jgi:hypothetical protein
MEGRWEGSEDGLILSSSHLKNESGSKRLNIMQKKSLRRAQHIVAVVSVINIQINYTH